MSQLESYFALAIAVHGVAVVVVNLTPTPRDNALLDRYSRLAVRAYRVIEVLAGIVDSRNVKR